MARRVSVPEAIKHPDARRMYKSILSDESLEFDDHEVMQLVLLCQQYEVILALQEQVSQAIDDGSLRMYDRSMKPVADPLVPELRQQLVSWRDGMRKLIPAKALEANAPQSQQSKAAQTRWARAKGVA